MNAVSEDEEVGTYSISSVYSGTVPECLFRRPSSLNVSFDKCYQQASEDNVLFYDIL